MNFEEAVKAMEEGKICECDGGRHYKIENANTIKCQDSDGIWKESVRTISQFINEKWKKVEKITLSDELAIYTPVVINEVKEANKKFINFLEAREKSIEVDRHETIRQGAKRIYGEKLC